MADVDETALRNRTSEDFVYQWDGVGRHYGGAVRLLGAPRQQLLTALESAPMAWPSLGTQFCLERLHLIIRWLYLFQVRSA